MRESERPQPALGLAIHQFRIKRGATQKEIADAAGITRRSLSFIENGGANPTWATIQDIADAFEISMSELAKRAEQLKAEGKDKPLKSAAGRPPSRPSRPAQTAS